MMKYRSTRGERQELTSADAVIRGLASDRGLYVPEEIPALPFAIKDMLEQPYTAFAEKVIGAFFDDYTQEEIHSCVQNAYTNTFEAKEIVPVVHAGDAWFLELYHGRTAAFKDMALSILPYLLTTAVKKQHDDHKICILTATSGDTGKAAMAGFADVPGTEIIVFYPNNGVSQVQEQQMRTQEGKNVHVFSIEGNFDDAQTGVKTIFQDPDFAAELDTKGIRLSSANSINIGRLVPQIAYYVYGYAQLVKQGAVKDGDPVNITVPTGNFGNILAAYYAKQMGIPVKKLICASNQNRVLTDFLTTGVYNANRDFYQTNSPSMDILVSSNLERLLYHLSNDDSSEIASLMQSLDKDRKYEIPSSMKDKLSLFSAGSADMKETDAAIGEMYKKNHYLMDTHTAVAYYVYEQYRRETGDETPTLIASTASPYKFADSVAASIGLPKAENSFRCIDEVAEETGVPVPASFKGLESRPILHDQVIKVSEMKNAVADALK
jgi:threonine synthase